MLQYFFCLRWFWGGACPKKMWKISSRFLTTAPGTKDTGGATPLILRPGQSIATSNHMLSVGLHNYFCIPPWPNSTHRMRKRGREKPTNRQQPCGRPSPSAAAVAAVPVRRARGDCMQVIHFCTCICSFP